MANTTVLNAGPWQDLHQHVFEHGPTKAPGKLFVKEALGATGCEMSLNKLPAGAAYPFTHRHQQNEELYVVVSGSGEFYADGQLFPLSEGTVLRVAPAGVRSIKAGDEADLCFLCIQAAAGTLTGGTITDGEMVDASFAWPTATAQA
ncbi:Cupin domain protein [Posidoniimonas polymericola]|uniref:Cupin domain protein n=1 Tax=Posidoniimonas polymericola TaxID=2528002 RepID=A0A5C5YRU6_9BACT|nr:cupin domain-containing protein [Posidoniimonas polymericola]TWT77694.1 Cupin domain protein [Posidoniimonas polymericola]